MCHLPAVCLPGRCLKQAVLLLLLCQDSTCLSMGLSRWEIQCTLVSPEFRCVSTHRQMRKHRKDHWLLNFWQRIACCLLYIVYIVVAGVLTWQVWETIFPSQIWSKLSKLYFLLPNTVVIMRVCSSLSLKFCCWKHSYFLCLIRNLLKVLDRRY